MSAMLLLALAATCALVVRAHVYVLTSSTALQQDVLRLDPENVNPLVSYFGSRFQVESRVGEPGQKMRLLFDTSSAYSWVLGAECERTGPVCAGHHTYDRNISDTCFDIGRPKYVVYPTGTMQGEVLADDVRFKDLLVKRQPFADMNKVPGRVFDEARFDGMIGLARKSTQDANNRPFMQSLIEQKLIKDQIFSVFLQRTKDGLVPTVTLGGIATELIDGAPTVVPVVRHRTGLWQFVMDDIAFETSKRAPSTKMIARISTSSPFILGPNERIRELNARINAHPVESASGVYELKDCDLSKLPTLHITIDGRKLPITPQMYVIRVVDSKDRNRCISALAHGDSRVWTLGAPFVGPYMVACNADTLTMTFARVKN